MPGRPKNTFRKFRVSSRNSMRGTRTFCWLSAIAVYSKRRPGGGIVEGRRPGCRSRDPSYGRRRFKRGRSPLSIFFFLPGRPRRRDGHLAVSVENENITFNTAGAGVGWMLAACTPPRLKFAVSRPKRGFHQRGEPTCYRAGRTRYR